jgi:hypothetical protein
MNNLTLMGDTTPATKIYKHESHKLHIAAKAEGKYATLTFDAALVSLNVVNGTVNGTAIAAVTYGTDSDTTMAAVAEAIAACPGIKLAVVTEVAGGATDDRVIVVVNEATDTVPSLTGFAVTLGASQAGVVAATVDKNIKQGMPVMMNSSGNLEPATAATIDLSSIGIAIMDGFQGKEVAVAARGYVVLRCEANAAITAGAPVKFVSYNTTTGYSKVDDDTVTTASQMGWALEAAAQGDIFDVLVKN